MSLYFTKFHQIRCFSSEFRARQFPQSIIEIFKKKIFKNEKKSCCCREKPSLLTECCRLVVIAGVAWGQRPSLSLSVLYIAKVGSGHQFLMKVLPRSRARTILFQEVWVEQLWFNSSGNRCHNSSRKNLCSYLLGFQKPSRCSQGPVEQVRCGMPTAQTQGPGQPFVASFLVITVGSLPLDNFVFL